MIKTIKEILRTTFINPLKEFVQDSRAIGMMLVVATLVSLAIANSPLAELYSGFWNGEMEWLQALRLPSTVLHVVNDLLMAVFFFMAGMEIRRELVRGELSSARQAALPVIGAVGGMIVPALIFLVFNLGTEYQGGWGIPAATDIAFTIGIASMLGNRVSMPLMVFLTALAIIDDLGAIIIIALFYGGEIHTIFMISNLLIIIILYILLKAKIKFGIWQILLGMALWFCMFNSGIHATVAGVIYAFLIPVELLEKFELKLHNLVYFFIMPFFALANTALPFSTGMMRPENITLTAGIALGLFVGKPLGISLLAYLAVKMKVAALPSGVSMYRFTGATILAGIGFTMSIFIAALAFPDVATQDNAKMAVFLGSGLSIAVAYVWLSLAPPGKEVADN